MRRPSMSVINRNNDLKVTIRNNLTPISRAMIAKQNSKCCQEIGILVHS